MRGIASQDDWVKLKASRDLSGVVFLTKPEMGGLGKNAGAVPSAVVKAVKAAAAQHDGFAFAWRRSPKAVVYFLYGREGERLLAVTRNFAGEDTAFEGLRVDVVLE